MDTDTGVVYKIASRASRIGVMRFRMPRNVYSWMYGFARLSQYSKARCIIEFDEYAEDVFIELRELRSFFIASCNFGYVTERIKEECEKAIRENREELLAKDAPLESELHKISLKTISQTDLYKEKGWDSFENVVELVKFFSERAKENGIYYFHSFTGSSARRADPDKTKDPGDVDWDFEDALYRRILKKEEYDTPQPGTEEYKVVMANRMIKFYSERIERAATENDLLKDTYYEALFDHETMWEKLDIKNSRKEYLDKALSIYSMLLSSDLIDRADRYSIKVEMDSFIRDEHTAERAAKKLEGNVTIDDIREEIRDEMQVKFDIQLERARIDIEKSYRDMYELFIPGSVEKEVKKLLPDLFKEKEKPESKPYRVYRSSSYSYAQQLQGEFDTKEEAQKYAAQLNEEMDKMASETWFDMKDYRSAYVEGPKEDS